VVGSSADATVVAAAAASLQQPLFYLLYTSGQQLSVFQQLLSSFALLYSFSRLLFCI
jgi:hypothetical protein